MSRHLYFGIPATFAMFGLAIMALLRRRQEAAAFRQLREETLRRHSTELALQQAQKMEAVGQLTGWHRARFQQPADDYQRQPRYHSPPARRSGVA